MDRKHLEFQIILECLLEDLRCLILSELAFQTRSKEDKGWKTSSRQSIRWFQATKICLMIINQRLLKITTRSWPWKAWVSSKTLSESRSLKWNFLREIRALNFNQDASSYKNPRWELVTRFTILETGSICAMKGSMEYYNLSHLLTLCH